VIAGNFLKDPVVGGRYVRAMEICGTVYLVNRRGLQVENAETLKVGPDFGFAS